jgi:hypothetical protein
MAAPFPLYDEDFEDIQEVQVDDSRYTEDSVLATDGVYCCVATGVLTEDGRYLAHTRPSTIDDHDSYVAGIAESLEEGTEGLAVHVAGPETDDEDLQASIETLDGYDHDIAQVIVESEESASLALDDDGFYRYDPRVRFEERPPTLS